VSAVGDFSPLGLEAEGRGRAAEAAEPDARIRQALLRQVGRSVRSEVARDARLVLWLARQGHRVDSHYLARRERSRWWSKSQLLNQLTTKDQRVKNQPRRFDVPVAPEDAAPADPDSPEAVDEARRVLSKLAPLGVVFFASSFNLTLLQNLRDALIVTSSGAEVLPFLSAFCVLPASVAFFIYYSNLVQRMHPRQVYYAAVGTLVSVYAAFVLFLYPNRAELHLPAAGAWLRAHLPAGLHGLAALVQDWTFSLFFCFAEIWGSVCISLLFWGLANDVCTVDEAKTVYPLMGLAANVGLIAAGSYMRWAGGVFSRLATTVASAGGGITQASISASEAGILGLLQLYITSLVGMTAVMFASKAYIDKRFLDPQRAEAAAAAAALAGPKTPEAAAADAVDPTGRGGDASSSRSTSAEADDAGKGKKGKDRKPRATLGETLRVLIASPKIRNLSLLVMCYSVSHRLFEFSWKGQLRGLYPDLLGYQSLLASVSIATGWATMLMMVAGRFVFQRLGWGFAAQATPLVMVLSGGFFFLSSLAPRVATALGVPPGGSLWGMDPAALLAAGALAGCVTQVFARASKFSLFDPAKEMVYIEMSREEKERGKAAVDLIGAQVGKSGGAWVTQAMLLLTGTLQASLPAIAAAFLGIAAVWVKAARELEQEMLLTERQRRDKRLAKAGGGEELSNDSLIEASMVEGDFEEPAAA